MASLFSNVTAPGTTLLTGAEKIKLSLPTIKANKYRKIIMRFN